MSGLISQKKLLITSKNYNQAIQIKDASVLVNSEVLMSQITENEEQIFILYQVEDDMDMTKNYYYIANLRSELLLTVKGNKLVQTNYSNINEQKFQFIELPNGCYIIQQKGSDKVLEVIQSQQSDSMSLTANHFSYGYGNQLFTLKESFRMFDMNEEKFLVNDICQQAKFQLVPNIPVNIKCAHSNLYFDVFEHSKIKNGQIVQWSQNNKNNQKFVLERVEIEQPIEKLIQQNAKPKQLNHILQTKTSLVVNEPNYQEGVYYVRCVESNLYLTILDERISDGGKLIQDELLPFSKNNHQRFIFQVLINGNFHIKPYHSKKYLDIEGDSYNCGANVIQFHKNCQLNQQFEVIYL